MPGIYAHFPFCIRKCLYCDFNSYAGLESFQLPYVSALLKEARARAADIRREEETTFDTVFFGGGTPTVLSSEQIALCLDEIYHSFSISPNAEVSIEANPGTVTVESLRQLRTAGFNRISIGVQTFDPRLLRQIGRIHGPEDAENALTFAAAAGFENVGLDIMFGLPDQTVSQFCQDLRRALGFRPAHVSVYSLIIEEGTPFWLAADEGTIKLPDDETVAESYEIAERMLDEAGYVHYEISNWAREMPPGSSLAPTPESLLAWSSERLRRSLSGRNIAYCRHNLNYWDAGVYIGLGAGAHSFWTSCRFNNTREPQAYIAAVEGQRRVIENAEQISVETAMSEYMILRLRTAAGASKTQFGQRFGSDMAMVYGKEIEFVTRKGLGEFDGESLRLTARGRILGNEALVQFVGAA